MPPKIEVVSGKETLLAIRQRGRIVGFHLPASRCRWRSESEPQAGVMLCAQCGFQGSRRHRHADLFCQIERPFTRLLQRYHCAAGIPPLCSRLG